MKVAWGSIGNMANLKPFKAIQIGVIAEDKSDVEVIKVLIKKYTDASKFSVKNFVGNGCGRLKNKCKVWAEALIDRGCEYILVIHDLDREKENKLKTLLQSKLPEKNFPKLLIVIPKEELEAWLLGDPEAIKSVFSLKELPKNYLNPETVPSPKEEIGKIVWAIAKKRYLNTVHNVKIAQLATIENLLKCGSYSPLDALLKDTIFLKTAVAIVPTHPIL